MNPVYDFSAADHAVMVGDQVRLEAYRRGIQNQVKEGMIVAEVGTGTGILSAYAASCTKAPIYAIEFFPNTAEMAEAMMKAAGLNQVQVLRGESYKITVDPQPDVLITETIGSVGPEENIVEICYDFKKRHPKIKLFIPSRLRMFAEPIRSARVRGVEKDYHDSFASASFGTFDYKAIRPTVAKIWSGHVRFNSLHEAETAGEPTLLVDYILGETQYSAFSKTLDFTGNQGMDAVHVYFEAEMDKEVILTSYRMDPETHWRHAYFSKPKDQHILTISYSPESEFLTGQWS